MIYEDIARVNKEIKTMDIKGKNYAPVQERITAFRKLYPTGSILTELVSNENGVCIFRATVGFTDEQGNFTILGQGSAYEKEGSSYINKTSYVENCETSATGRALGMAGIGIDESVASFEEVANAMANQGQTDLDEPITEKQLELIKKIAEKDGKTLNDEEMRKWTKKQASDFIEKCKGGNK